MMMMFYHPREATNVYGNDMCYKSTLLRMQKFHKFASILEQGIMTIKGRTTIWLCRLSVYIVLYIKVYYDVVELSYLCVCKYLRGHMHIKCIVCSSRTNGGFLIPIDLKQINGYLPLYLITLCDSRISMLPHHLPPNPIGCA